MTNSEQFGCGDPNCLDCGCMNNQDNLDDQVLSTAKQKIEGIVVVYLYVGSSLTTDKIEPFVDKNRERFKDLFERLRQQGWENMIVPLRNQPSRVELLALK